jgi:DNA-binding NtrC family response regulator
MPGTDGITLLKEWADSGRLDPVIMMSGHGTVDTAVEATRLGALDFIEKPVSLTKLLRTVSRVLDNRRDRPARSMGSHISLTPVGKSERVRQLKQRITQLAKLDTNVILVGEPGSGRALFAYFLAANSRRSIAPFETIRGRHLNSDDADRILLGKADQPGALERANGGVLFIDGIESISSRAEIILLDAVATRRIARMNQQGHVQLDIRFVASQGSSEDDAGADIVSGLGAVVVHVPPLRDHSEDVPELLRFHADLLVDEQRLPFRRFSIAAQNRLRNYPWPGNVEELRGVVRQLLVFGGDEEIGLAEVEAQLRAETSEAEPLIKQDLLAMPLREAREHFERAYLTQQLELCGGKVGQLAKRVGMERTHLYRKLRALGVDFRQSGGDD